MLSMMHAGFFMLGLCVLYILNYLVEMLFSWCC